MERSHVNQQPEFNDPDARIDKDLVTVIIPTFNRKGFLSEAIRSVQFQTHRNWELIIVDDGSTDGTAEWIEAMEDPGIRLVKLDHSGHAGRLRNRGVWEGNGKWIAFLDSDDVWLPQKLEEQLKAVQKSGARWCYTNYELMDESGKWMPVKAGQFRPLSGKIIRQLLNYETSLTTCSLLIERSLFEEAGAYINDPEMQSREDFELELRLALRADVVAVPEMLVRIREHPGRTTSSLQNPHEWSALPFSYFLDLKPGKELENIAKKRRGYHLAEAAGKNIRFHKYGLAFKQLCRAFRDGDTQRHILSVLYRSLVK